MLNKKKISIALCGLALVFSAVNSQAQVRSVAVMPKPRAVTAQENRSLVDTIQKLFEVKAGEKLEMQAAGPYRFAGNKQVLYIARTDVGSMAFETAAYGAANRALNEEENSRERLLKRIDAALDRAGINAPNRQFGWFQDELAGAVPRTQGLPPDPREHSKLVARTVAYTRSIDGVPIFGSELLVGLNPEGQIGRLRLHWPNISPDLVTQARRLQAAVDAKKWQLPKTLSDSETKILEVNAGVGHSGFSDPRFRSAAVVRVLYRREAKGEYPLVTTAYEYFDLQGREVKFSAFPRTAGTSAKLKKRQSK